MKFAFPKNEVVLRTVDVLLSPYMTPDEYTSERRMALGGYARDLFAEVARYAKAAEQIARDETFDVIHAHDWLAFPAGRAAQRATGKPLVLHVHLPSVDQGGGQGYDTRVFELEKEAFHHADAIIAVSGRVRDSLIHDYGVSASKIQVVYNGLDVEEAREFGDIAGRRVAGGHSDPVALFMGRLTMHKAPDKFLAAAPLVLSKCPEARFIVAGSGEAEHQLIRQAASSGILRRTYFTGFVRDTERMKLLSNADVLVMPSIAEPFGLVALEALASGTPVIVSKQSGVSEVLKNALSVNFWDVEELAHKMLAIFRYSTLAHELSTRGGTEARAATWSRAADSCTEMYNGLVCTV
jgi:glycosyltransferase involved in cell wall biosynthesis